MGNIFLISTLLKFTLELMLTSSPISTKSSAVILKALICESFPILTPLNLK